MAFPSLAPEEIHLQLTSAQLVAQCIQLESDDLMSTTFRLLSYSAVIYLDMTAYSHKIISFHTRHVIDRIILTF